MRILPITNLGQIGKEKKNREGPPYTMPFLRRKNSAQSPGSSGQLRKRASWILHPSHTTPACKTRPNPDLKPQTSNPKFPTSNLTLKIPSSTPSHVCKSQTVKSQTSQVKPDFKPQLSNLGWGWAA